MRVVGLDVLLPRAGCQELLPDELRDLLFLAALAGDGHELQDQLLGAGKIGEGKGLGEDLGMVRLNGSWNVEGSV